MWQFSHLTLTWKFWWSFFGFLLNWKSKWRWISTIFCNSISNFCLRNPWEIIDKNKSRVATLNYGESSLWLTQKLFYSPDFYGFTWLSMRVKLNKATFPDNKEKKLFFLHFMAQNFSKKETFPIRSKKLLQLNRNFAVCSVRKNLFHCKL